VFLALAHCKLHHRQHGVSNSGAAHSSTFLRGDTQRRQRGPHWHALAWHSKASSYQCISALALKLNVCRKSARGRCVFWSPRQGTDNSNTQRKGEHVLKNSATTAPLLMPTPPSVPSLERHPSLVWGYMLSTQDHTCPLRSHTVWVSLSCYIMQQVWQGRGMRQEAYQRTGPEGSQP
jgi:hypothetical protein